MSDVKQQPAAPVRKSKLEVADATEAPHRSLERNPRTRSVSIPGIENPEMIRHLLHRKQSMYVSPTGHPLSPAELQNIEKQHWDNRS